MNIQQRYLFPSVLPSDGATPGAEFRLNLVALGRHLPRPSRFSIVTGARAGAGRPLRPGGLMVIVPAATTRAAPGHGLQ